MVRQWQEFFYERRYAATPLLNPDFVRSWPSAYGLERRSTVTHARRPSCRAVEAARETIPSGPSCMDFKVEQEDSVFPMVPAGADLDKMIRRPSPSSDRGDGGVMQVKAGAGDRPTGDRGLGMRN